MLFPVTDDPIALGLFVDAISHEPNQIIGFGDQTLENRVVVVGNAAFRAVLLRVVTQYFFVVAARTARSNKSRSMDFTTLPPGR